MSKPNKVKYGLKNVHVAPMTETDNGIVSFGTPRRIPGAVNLSLPPVGENTPFYADDVEYFTAITNNGYEGNIEFALVPDWFKAAYLGEVVDENFVQIEHADVQPSPFALMFEFDGDKRKTRHVLFNCKASRPELSANTKNDSPDVDTDTLSLRIAAQDFTIGGVKKGVVQGHIEKTAENAAKYASFFQGVVIPGQA